MNKYLPLGKLSFGMGDRFGHQGKAQLRACMLATELGAEFIPVWNKSNREHSFIGTEPASLRAEADAAVKALGWPRPYHVDADQKIPGQTIAPKFTGRFNQGVDYVGDLKQFEQEFNEDLTVIAFAVKQYG